MTAQLHKAASSLQNMKPTYCKDLTSFHITATLSFPNKIKNTQTKSRETRTEAPLP